MRIFNNDELQGIKKDSVVLGGATLQAGEKTTLNDFFNGEVTYLGIYEDYLQFEIGKEVNLFETLTYTNEFSRVDENRILTIYQAGTARNYDFKREQGYWK
ncbi:MAG: Unknown protein [uncultured Sulfurovum sp.]|uniref:Uncharacterized protein n=1 Tax=uncultured Sulfurovum sp. TaxID=269237 RepID=A0A6S6TXG6_9BACT|nr:MAG: Unknown protein [uncultured Sulfurovum sp.]